MGGLVINNISNSWYTILELNQLLHNFKEEIEEEQ